MEQSDASFTDTHHISTISDNRMLFNVLLPEGHKIGSYTNIVKNITK